MKLYPDNWRYRLITGVVAAACLVAAMILGPVVGIHGFWPYMLLIAVASFVGPLLGRLVYRLVSRSSSGDPPDHPPRA
ncbi:MAG: hypothetical protein KIS67_21925 [Verrucomicrobiae bacterium]|nr:hypothetical protein [Verrucomicrobiae bacterium]